MCLRPGQTARVYPRSSVRGISNSGTDLDGRLWRHRAPLATVLQLVMPLGERRGFIHRYHDSIFAGHLGVSRTVFRLLDRVYWAGLCEDVRSYLASCPVCLAWKSLCPRRAPIGHVFIGKTAVAVADAFFHLIIQ